jgi:hypothetical protein
MIKILMIFTVFLSACEQQHSEVVKSPVLKKMPSGMIQIKPNLYYKPIKKNQDNGCMMWRLYAKNRQTAQVILYEHQGAKFSPDKTHCL